MSGNGPNSTPYLYLRKTEDLLALAADIEDHRQTIFTHAFQETSWDAVYDEAFEMGIRLELLMREIRTAWHDIREFVEGVEP